MSGKATAWRVQERSLVKKRSTGGSVVQGILGDVRINCEGEGMC